MHDTGRVRGEFLLTLYHRRSPNMTFELTKNK